MSLALPYLDDKKGTASDPQDETLAKYSSELDPISLRSLVVINGKAWKTATALYAAKAEIQKSPEKCGKPNNGPDPSGWRLDYLVFILKLVLINRECNLRSSLFCVFLVFAVPCTCN